MKTISKIALSLLVAINVAEAAPTADSLAVGCGLPQPNCTEQIVDLTDGSFSGSFTSLTATGLSTLTGQVALGSETVAGAGATVADAAALSASVGVHRITGANGTVGWKFVTATPIGSVQILLNTTAGVANIYAESGGTVNGGSADAAFTALTGIKPIICVKTAALTYLCS